MKRARYLSVMLSILMFIIVMPADAAPSVVLNGRNLNFDVPPITIQGRTLVPLRAIFEALGAKVGWDAETNTITGTKDNINIMLKANSTEGFVNGNKIVLDVPATVVDGRTLVPIRFIAESLGAKVNWDELTNTVGINTLVTESEKGYTPATLIYKSNAEPSYSVYTRRSIDTLIIAAGLYTNFNSPYLLPNVDERVIYKNAKEYFGPYKEHAFIKGFGKYMEGNDVKSSYMAFLLNYSDLPELKKAHDNPQKYLSNEKEAQEFLNSLKAFYIDTNAETFFENNASSYKALNSYINENIKQSNMLKLISDVESYTGNKEKYFAGKNVSYSTVLSFYRTIGSFAVNENITLASMQYAYNSSSPTSQFNMNSIMKTSVHEYLHNYINKPVQNNDALINELSQGEDKNEYISSLYVLKSFPWNRATDENIVRAVEARLYKKEFGEDRAIRDIIDPETQYGFKQVRKIYDKLEEYEKDRNKYPTIDDFMPELIKEMFKKN